ncbi:MAG: (2Fe-2S)-binding protein, partial [Pirellulales bacterium]
LIDGRPSMASTTLAVAVAGKAIETIEGLGGDQPDEVSRAFVAHDAQQCGYCTPGFVVAVRAFLNKHPQATAEEIRKGLNGNICRCGTYVNVLEAALAVVQGANHG